MLWFEKYEPSEVSVSALRNDLRSVLLSHHIFSFNSRLCRFTQALNAAVEAATCFLNQQTSRCLAGCFHRVAIVMMSGAQRAEAAVRELNGCSMKGRALHVEHINRAAGESQNQNQSQSQSQSQASISGPESLQGDAKPQTSQTESSSTERKVKFLLHLEETGGHQQNMLGRSKGRKTNLESWIKPPENV